MKEDEEGVDRDEAQISGRTQGPYGTDDSDAERAIIDNKHRPEMENTSNGMDSVQVRGGQDGRNNRAMGGMDMDSHNGVIRMGDMDNSTMEVTEEGKENAISNQDKTNTSTVDVTTHGPDDYASADEVGVPEAQREAKESAQDDDADDDNSDAEQLAQTGTDTEHKPTY
ncbi:hypothetical protein DYU11_08735 [Fibrisoma montanum]|uniref:Uncharacterized protein n=1 Tax=Fibrisoma montanum TaxID=2305895 RepID=A0A418MF41_9BACT|nr:hypothetical protein [Fibrisoma montanum]RIV25375.1 hypothetical protein DYU11_08735 [Fibrisoma montanum]